jgi:hypothetical protein
MPRPRKTTPITASEKDAARAKKTQFSSMQSLFQNYALDDKGGYITQEFQDFGYRLAIDLDDIKHKSLYMKLAKTESRSMLERALSFVSDAASVKSKAKLFMWKFKQLKTEAMQKNKESKNE